MGKVGILTRQTVLKPLGLMTTPNPYGVYPEGALSDATNAVMRAPGRVSAAPAGTNYITIVGASTTELIYVLAPLDNGHVLSLTWDGSFWRFYEGVAGSAQNNGAPVLQSSVPAQFSDSRVGWTRSRDRALFNSNYGVQVCDFMQPASLAQRSLRIAGLRQPRCVIQIHFAASTTAIPTNVMVAYTAIITREYADGYILKSVPGPPSKMLNDSGATRTYDIFIGLSQTGIAALDIQAGDFVELYRTDGLATTSVTADPGSTFKQVQKHKITVAEAASGNVTLTDNQQLVAPFYTTPGEELYTNPYQEGANNANRQPDVCKAIATFKSFTFYGNLTERAQWVFQVPAGINSEAVNLAGNPKRQYGIGSRTVVGTVTLGSPTITAVNAANLVGIQVGQMLNAVAGPFPFGTQVTAVGATTITMGANATAGAASIVLNDVIELNGNANALLSLDSLFNFYSEITTSVTFSHNTDGDTPGAVIVIEPPSPAGVSPPNQTVTIRATNGANFSPPVPEYTAAVQTFNPTPRPNLLRWSKDSEPEHVPSINETFVGSGQIIAMVATKDALWIACTDGIYRLSGDGGQWRVDTVAPSCILCAPRCMVNLRETVFAYTNLGFGAITDSGFVPISDKILRSSLPGSPFAEDYGMIMGVHPVEGEVYIRKFITDYLWVYNTTSQAFTRISDVAAHLQYITAIAWQETPGSTLTGTPLFGLLEPSTKPALVQWNATATKLNLAVTYHPFFGEDPFGNKQWIDVVYMFDGPAVANVMQASFSNEAFVSTVPIVAAQGGGQAACVVGVPRKFAIAPKVVPGFGVQNILSNALDHLGVSVRYVPLTLQSGARK